MLKQLLLLVLLWQQTTSQKKEIYIELMDIGRH